MKTLHKTSLATLLVASALLSPVITSAGADIVSDTPPPAPRVEHEPAPRDGYVWAPGYWEWNGRFFNWISGTWVPERRGKHWVADRWEQLGSQWHYVRGHWEQ
ncbi:MAG: YXWGXW repeat-containing protein [Steroidobacteraceae bacterium]